jgi:hypothetical protein
MNLIAAVRLPQRVCLVFGSAVALLMLSACMGTRVTTTQELTAEAGAPFRNILVIVLLENFDNRKGFEKAIIKSLAETGTTAVGSTSMMKTTTPMTRQTYLAMLDEFDADALMVTHLVDAATKAGMRDMRPETTVNVRPTYYYNVWEVEVTEYLEPQMLEMKATIELATVLYSVQTREMSWAMESKSKIDRMGGSDRNFMIFNEEAAAMVKRMGKDGLLAQ